MLPSLTLLSTGLSSFSASLTIMSDFELFNWSSLVSCRLLKLGCQALTGYWSVSAFYAAILLDSASDSETSYSDSPASSMDSSFEIWLLDESLSADSDNSSSFWSSKISDSDSDSISSSFSFSTPSESEESFSIFNPAFSKSKFGAKSSSILDSESDDSDRSYSLLSSSSSSDSELSAPLNSKF